VLKREHEICRKEKEIEEWDKILANKEKSINARVEALRQFDGKFARGRVGQRYPAQ